MDERSKESSVRRLAKRHGYAVKKSRQWANVPNADNYGEYMLLDASSNSVVLGSSFDASLDEIRNFLT